MMIAAAPVSIVLLQLMVVKRSEAAAAEVAAMHRLMCQMTRTVAVLRAAFDCSRHMYSMYCQCPFTSEPCSAEMAVAQLV
jgi:hypothetical protein